MKKMKKLLLSFFLALFLFSSSLGLLASSVKATAPVWFDTNPRDFPSWYLKVYDDEATPATEIFGERYTAAQVQWIFYSLISGTLNGVLTRQGMLCAMKFKTGDIAAVINCLKAIPDFVDIVDNSSKSNFSLAGFFASQPISAIGYTIRGYNNFSLIPIAHAQGYGYTTAGSAVQEVWKVTRNIAYSFLVLIVIAFAFMIMFRMKVNPQTVVTIQSALPKIIIAIVLITFSYAIAGLLIDLMYVAIGIISLIFTSSGMSDISTADLFQKFAQDNIFGRSVMYIIQLLIATFGGLISGAGEGVEGGTGIAGILMIIVIFHILIKYLSIVVMIFKTYATIIISIFTAPLEILFGTITAGGFGGWIRRMLSNLIVFPLLNLMMFLSFFFAAQSGANLAQYGTKLMSDFTTKAWKAPYLHAPGSGAGFVWIIVSYAIFVSIPKAAEIASGIISGKMPNLESAIGESYGPAAQFGQGMANWKAAAVSEKAAASGAAAGRSTRAWDKIYRFASGFTGGKINYKSPL